MFQEVHQCCSHRSWIITWESSVDHPTQLWLPAGLTLPCRSLATHNGHGTPHHQSIPHLHGVSEVQNVPDKGPPVDAFPTRSTWAALGFLHCVAHLPVAKVPLPSEQAFHFIKDDQDDLLMIRYQLNRTIQYMQKFILLLINIYS